MALGLSVDRPLQAADAVPLVLAGLQQVVLRPMTVVAIRGVQIQWWFSNLTLLGGNHAGLLQKN
jgi:hypothetical protein